MSNDIYKKFIENLSIEHNLPIKTTWKRIKSFKKNDLIMQQFENNEGDEILISEDSSGFLNLVHIEPHIELPQEIKDKMNSIHLLSELYKIYFNLSSQSNELEIENINTISSKAIRKYLLLNDDSFIKKDLISFKPGENKELEIGHQVLYYLSFPESNIENNSSLHPNFVDDTSSENVGVLYDKENMELYYCEKDGISFFKAICGGDWEIPIQFLVYWSESEGRLKGFFPKGDANIYNKKYNCAYGSEYEKINESDFPNKESYNKVQNDIDNIMEKINDNYNLYFKESFHKAFKEMKKIILKENLSKKHKP